MCSHESELDVDGRAADRFLIYLSVYLITYCACSFSLCAVSTTSLNPSNITTMSNKCAVCDKLVPAKVKVKIQCNDCNGVFHGGCVKLSQEDIDYIVEEKSIWRCGPCQSIRRKSLQVEVSLSEGKDSKSDEIMSFLREMREESKAQMAKLENDLGKSIEACHEQATELLKVTEEQSKRLKEYEKYFEALRQENTNLRAEIKTQKEKIDEMEQYSRANCLEINGIPESKSETVLEIIKKVGTVLNVNVKDEDIDACHRLGTKLDGKNRGIIVKFVRRTMKDEILRKRKIKRNLNTSDIGFSSGPADVVYINESLSAERRKVLSAARGIKRDQGYTYVWVKNGKVFLRKNEGDKAVVLTNMEQAMALTRK